jgi:hypothetical protein
MWLEPDFANALGGWFRLKEFADQSLAQTSGTNLNIFRLKLSHQDHEQNAESRNNVCPFQAPILNCLRSVSGRLRYSLSDEAIPPGQACSPAVSHCLC